MLRNIKLIGILILLTVSGLLTFPHLSYAGKAGPLGKTYIRQSLSNPQNVTITRDAFGNYTLNFSVTENASGAAYNFTTGPLQDVIEYYDETGDNIPEGAQVTVYRTR